MQRPNAATSVGEEVAQGVDRKTDQSTSLDIKRLLIENDLMRLP